MVSLAVVLSTLALGALRVQADRVLVLGAQDALFHDAVGPNAAFTPVGLAELTLDAFGLPTGKIEALAGTARAPAQSPVQADLFQHVNAFAMVFVDQNDASVLEKLNAGANTGYHKVFDVATGSAAGKVPQVIAEKLSKSVGAAEVKCVGSTTVCQGAKLVVENAGATQIDRVYKDNKYLDKSKKADVAFANELAQLQQLTDTIEAKKEVTSTYYVASFSTLKTLDADKVESARSAVVEQVQELLRAMQKAYPKSGAQVVASSALNAVASPQATEELLAVSRMLVDFSDVSGSDDDDDDDDDSDSDSAVNATKSDVTIDDIAEYQIVLWTSVLLGAVLLLVIMALCNMDTKRDSLLYAKFTTNAGSRKYD
ncbi:hypothetical protein Poli38472_009867 [Pythium oligandrum]|uniref:Uncharacterized protein n=1 Tax=Pythium oligandrum TaxID=41045 RepID=A0A8K1CG20_PYTOL|nr:hypothetical protein Poli38472_009867 [Pythium oligandrum]|eukprot:TMW62374.1 hypothetical protein Poli38472_009867 [Pythium oligandrum]